MGGSVCIGDAFHSCHSIFSDYMGQYTRAMSIDQITGSGNQTDPVPALSAGTQNHHLNSFEQQFEIQ
jgi:hypothetical protein